MDSMNTVFREYLHSFFIFFTEDIFVDSKSEDENMGHCMVVLQVFM